MKIISIQINTHLAVLPSGFCHKRFTNSNITLTKLYPATYISHTEKAMCLLFRNQ